MIQRDKVLHAAVCAAAAVIVMALVWVALLFGLPWAMFAGGSILAVSYEGLQAYRGEGEPSGYDAAAGIGGALAVSLIAHALSFT